MSRQRAIEVIKESEFVTIGELVRLTSMRYSTLKFYVEEGMLPYEKTEENLTRRFKREQSVERIYLIKNLKEQGKTIPQIKDILMK